ncbi:MAG: TetR/AcrR family transcriptional regulator [Desulfobacter sp.]|nr:MAG: TetR/AcrR family transcriptional regulator [Desulfobacter sp.]
MKKKEDTKQIYKAALSVFSRYGFKKTTMDDVAGKLGMTKGNLYLYAKNKKALYIDMISWALKRWQSKVAKAVGNEKEIRQKFETLCQKAVDYLSEDKELHRILVNDPGIFPMFPDQDPFESINKKSVAMIRSILDQGIAAKVFRPVDTDQISQVIFLIYKVFIIQTYIKGQKVHIHKMLSETIGLMTHGLFLTAEN